MSTSQQTIYYKSVEFISPVRVHQGMVKQESVDEVDGLKLVRIIGPGYDDLVFEKEDRCAAHILKGTEVPWSNVASAIRCPEPTPVEETRAGNKRAPAKPKAVEGVT